jgi:hypothetical protein
MEMLRPRRSFLLQHIPLERLHRPRGMFQLPQTLRGILFDFDVAVKHVAAISSAHDQHQDDDGLALLPHAPAVYAVPKESCPERAMFPGGFRRRGRVFRQTIPTDLSATVF